MSTPQKILVATDLSEASVSALECAYDLACVLQASVRLVTVLDPTPFFSLTAMVPGASELRGLIPKQEEALTRKLADLGEKHFPGMQVTSTVLQDSSPAQAIADLAEEEKFEMVVVGSHGRTGVSRALLGSVAEKVVRLTRCPTLVVPSRSKE